VAVISVPLLLATPADAATGTYLRLAHLSPDTPQVDVYVTSATHPEYSLVLHGVGYGTVSDYQRVSAGRYTVSMRGAGAPASSPPVITTTIDAEQGSAHTVAGTGPNSKLALSVLTDDLTPPPAGQTRVRVINACDMPGPVTVKLADGGSVADSVAFGTSTDYDTVASGSTSLKVQPGATTPIDLPVDLSAGSVFSVLVLHRGGQLTAEAKLDASGPGVAPSGGVETGAGGMAGALDGTVTPGVPLLPIGIGLVAAAAAGMLLIRRLRVAAPVAVCDAAGRDAAGPGSAGTDEGRRSGSGGR
jgi:hypothetical protein